MPSAVPQPLRDELRRYSKSELVERLFLAEEVCSAMMLIMQFNMIKAADLDDNTRDLIVRTMTPWSRRVFPAADDAATPIVLVPGQGEDGFAGVQAEVDGGFEQAL